MADKNEKEKPGPMQRIWSGEQLLRRGIVAGAVISSAFFADGTRRVISNPPGTAEHDKGESEQRFAIDGIVLTAGTAIAKQPMDKRLFKGRRGKPLLELTLKMLQAISRHDSWEFDEENSRYTAVKVQGEKEATGIREALRGFLVEGAEGDITTDKTTFNTSVLVWAIDPEKLVKAVFPTPEQAKNKKGPVL